MNHRWRVTLPTGTLMAVFLAWGIVSPAKADVTVTVNASVSSATPISPYVYGFNFPDSAIASQMANHLGLARSGGNRWTAYNWENNASNAGSDWGPYSNDNYLCGSCQNSLTPGEAVRGRVSREQGWGMASLVTVPIVDYVSADKSGLVTEAQFAVTPGLTTYSRFNVNLARSGNPSGAVNTTNKYVYQDQFVYWLETTFPSASRTAPIFYSLDNEPALWPSTHPEVHQAQPTYAEMASRTVDFASMIKDRAPNATVFGPVTYGFNEMVNLQDASDANGRDYLDFYLGQLQAAHTSQGRRLLDTLDIHWYPEARGGGTRITELNSSSLTSAQIEGIVQAPRSYWDPSYREDSWIADWLGGGYQGLTNIQLIPRLRAKIAAHYPGTKIAITEHFPGGANHVAGGIAQADTLGIFGREGVFAATYWEMVEGWSPFILGGYQTFLNYDGAGSRVGDLSLPATTSNAAQSSVYAMRSTTDANKLWIVAINKTATAIPAHITISNGMGYGTYKLFRLTSASATPQFVSNNPISGSLIDYTMPAFSVSTMELSATLPTLTISNATITEGNGGTTNVTYTVTLTSTASASAEGTKTPDAPEPDEE